MSALVSAIAARLLSALPPALGPMAPMLGEAIARTAFFAAKAGTVSWIELALAALAGVALAATRLVRRRRNSRPQRTGVAAPIVVPDR